MMNHRAAMHLREIAHYAAQVADELDAGGFDQDGTIAFASELDHLLYHLSLAWHQSKMTDEAIDLLTPDEVSQLAMSIPKFDPDYTLIEM